MFKNSLLFTIIVSLLAVILIVFTVVRSVYIREITKDNSALHEEVKRLTHSDSITRHNYDSIKTILNIVERKGLVKVRNPHGHDMVVVKNLGAWFLYQEELKLFPETFEYMKTPEYKLWREKISQASDVITRQQETLLLQFLSSHKGFEKVWGMALIRYDVLDEYPAEEVQYIADSVTQVIESYTTPRYEKVYEDYLEYLMKAYTEKDAARVALWKEFLRKNTYDSLAYETGN